MVFLDKNHQEDGMDLIEVLIAIVIIIAAIISVTSLLIRSQVLQAKNESENRASLIAQDITEKTRNLKYATLGHAKAGVCSSTTTSNLPCNGESYFVVNTSKIQESQTQDSNGTTFTAKTYVTKINPNNSMGQGWDNTAGSQTTPGCYTTIPSNPVILTAKDGDGLAHLCTLKRITVEVTWNDGVKPRSIVSSWVRAPKPSEELPTSVNSNS